MTVTENARAERTTTPAWSGINHLALITNDMDATVRFYHGVLGARLAATVGTPEFRHYFFDFGPHCTVAFFEYADVAIEPFAKPAGVPDPRASQFDHSMASAPTPAVQPMRVSEALVSVLRFDPGPAGPAHQPVGRAPPQ